MVAWGEERLARSRSAVFVLSFDEDEDECSTG